MYCSAVQRVVPRVNGRSTEIYGFTLYISTFVFFLLFLIWAFVPEQFLHNVGIYYYPDKYWAIIIPSYIGMLFPFISIIYIGWNLYSTSPLNSLLTISDLSARLPDENDLANSLYNQSYSIPEISDLPLQLVNQLLYQKQRKQS